MELVYANDIAKAKLAPIYPLLYILYIIVDCRVSFSKTKQSAEVCLFCTPVIFIYILVYILGYFVLYPLIYAAFDLAEQIF